MTNALSTGTSSLVKIYKYFKRSYIEIIDISYVLN
jgi:hypothetical protein